MRREIEEIRKRAEVYSREKVFTFVLEIAPSGRKNFYNGYVISIKTDMIVFFDSKLNMEIPILLDYIEVIEPSKNEVKDDR